MDQWIEVTGKTEDEAIATALRQLDKEREEVSVEILERAKSGFLGLGSIPAKIRVTYSVGDDREKKIERFLTGLLQHLGSHATLHITEKENETIGVEFTGEHLGHLIGNRGETLDAIQQLTNYVVNRDQEARVRIHFDAQNYRRKREESLQRLAERVASKVVRFRKNVMLESMNAYERHVIHTALQEYAGVTTYSVGTEPNRRIVIAYKRV